MKINCFQSYFEPIYIYLKKVYQIALDNDFAVGGTALIATSIGTALNEFLDVNYFGVTNVLLLIVIATVFVDAGFGIKKSLILAKRAHFKAFEFPEGSFQRKRFLREFEAKKFSSTKLQFTFFKCLTLLGYLFFAKTLLEIGEENLLAEETLVDSVLNFSTEIIVKAPLAIFWYYDFKSIGENTEFIYGKKAPIFTITEMIFEPRIFKFLKGEETVKNNENIDEEIINENEGK